MEKFFGDAADRLAHYSIPEPNSGCHIWIASLTNSGYGAITYDDGKRNSNQAHRISYLVNRGPIPPSLCVLHKCDVRCCVNPEHLFLGTNADNMADMVKKGRARNGRNGPTNPRHGESHLSAKLTEAIVISILSDLRSAYRLARVYGVNASSINSIRAGKTWKHIDRQAIVAAKKAKA